MNNSPTFKPGDVAWHVQHGKVTLGVWAPDSFDDRPLWHAKYGRWYEDGREDRTDAFPILYTLDQARQYGWLKEPRVVEGFTEVDELGGAALHIPELAGKRVKVRVEEVLE